MSDDHFPEPHRPAERLDYRITWAARLADGEVIATSAWALPDDLELVSGEKTDDTTTALITGGTAGTTAELVNTVTTSLGHTMVERKTLYVAE